MNTRTGLRPAEKVKIESGGYGLGRVGLINFGQSAGIRELLTFMLADITLAARHKATRSCSQLLSEKIEHPINTGDKKVLMFCAFWDTAEYLFEQCEYSS
jgi:hypothetical protein